MKILLLPLALLVTMVSASAQYAYETSDSHPFGRPNPNAPREIRDYEPIIGQSSCTSKTRNPDGTWQESVDMSWEFRYIMNGMAVQDHVLKADGRHAGSIRQFNPDSSRWYVHYYVTGSTPAQLPAWGGGMEDSNIILYRDQKAPNGMSGDYRITFQDITDQGFEWRGDWVSKDRSIVYPSMTISCQKR